MIRFLYIDLFCGAGGTSTGVEAARLHGEQVAKVIACVNHDANAIASHAANHPDALHFVEDIRTLNLDRMLAHVEAMRKQYPAARVVLWASLECTNFSIAKGGQSRDADSRTLAEHLFRYIDALRPDYIQIENVKEFMTWGPLVDATFERIHAGLVKFVAGGKEAFMVKYNSMSQSGKYVAPGIDDPCPTVAVQSRLGVAKACFLAKHFSGSPADRAISIDGPAHAITTVDHHALVSGNFLTAYYGNGYNSPVEAPGPTVTTKDRFQLVQPRFLNMQYGNGGAVSVEEPAGTVTTTPKHHLVTCRLAIPARKGRYLLNPQYTSKCGSIETPCFTLIARMDKISPYIVTTEREGQQVAPFIRREGDTLIYEVYTTDSPIVVQIKEFMALYGLVDVKMRMLKIPELKRIMGFPANYKLVGTQAEQKKFIGNAVEVTMARVICEALGRMILDFENAA